MKDVDEGTAYDRQNICWINNMDTYPVDDDMNYTVLSLRVLERSGSNFTSEDVAQSWLFGLPAFHTCTAERVAYRNLMHGILPPESGILANPFREWIGAQIRVDFYGYIAAGNPALAAQMACRDAVVAQTKNGVYAAMYIAALIASAPVLPKPSGRELVNRIQNIRKSSGFEITDKIKITISKNTQTDDAVNEYNTYICNQVLGTSLDLADEVKDGTELNFDDFSLFVNVIKD